MACSIHLQGQEIVCFLPSGNSSSLQFIELQKQKFVKLSDLSEQTLIGSVYNPAKNLLSFKKGIIYLTNQSTELVFSAQKGKTHTVRMKYPVRTIQSDLYVPMEDFTYALNGLGLCSIERKGDNLYQFGKGIHPLMAATFDIPEEMQEPSEDEQEEHPLLSDNDNLLVSSQMISNKNIAIEQSTQKSATKKKILQAIAETAGISNSSVCTIVGISMEKTDSLYEVSFTANAGLEKFQKPEIRGREVLIRFPDSKDGTSSLSHLTSLPLVKAFEKGQIRTYLMYTVRFSQDIMSASIKRVNSKTVKVFITIKKTIQNDAPANVKGAWNLDVIILDPGHGGEDAGAISINGHKEKDIALSIAKKAKELLKKELPQTKVFLTRDDDTFIELYKRGQIANKLKGKLFISIHCNSMPTKPHPANGCESYILRPGRNSEAVRVAEKENASIKLEKEQLSYDDMSEEKLIISTMAQSAFVKFSEKFAAMLQKDVSGTTGLFNRGVNQAGFLVLVGASMPNVLFETGFLSNIQDEKLLSSDRGQQGMAEGIVKAVKRYANEYVKNN